MAGGATTVELVAAVCESGGAGFVAAAYSTPEQITDFCRAVRAHTRRPFGINLFAPTPIPQYPDDPRPALERIAPFHAELGIAPPSLPASPGESFDAQLAAALGGGASYFSFTFGIPPSDALAAIRPRPSKRRSCSSRPASTRWSRKEAKRARTAAASWCLSRPR
jgi:nitronate monooxygenase